MPLLGSLIKTALDVHHQLSTLPEDPLAVQQSQLDNLLLSARDTAFGKFYNFNGMLQTNDLIRAFQTSVPIHSYGQLHKRWWFQQQLHPDITWPGQPQYFALSSGTTGKRSKRIPVTQDMLTSFRRVGQSQIAALANFDLPADCFEKDVLMLSSSADLTPHKQHLEGEISGINSLHIPDWFDRFYKPGKAIAQINDWETRVAAIARAAPEWDIVAIAGIPSWVRMMLQHVIAVHQLDTIHDIWPNLCMYASGGVAFEPYRKSFSKLTARPIHIMDTYLASEGFFAFTARPDTMAMQLAIQHGIFYEFIPFDERGFDETGQLLDDPAVLHLGEVVEGEDYALLASTPAGAWRYLIGDTVRFTDLSRYELIISGRTKYYLNVVGSQLSEDKLNAAVTALSNEKDVQVNEFAVAALEDEDGQYYHQWVLGCSDELPNELAAQQLDQYLQEVNKNYRVARQKALHDVRVRVVPEEQLYNWLEQRKNKKGGQIKLPKVMKAKMMRKLLTFLAL